MLLRYRATIISWCLLFVLFPVGAHAAYPLITEDTGTQGQGRHQIEFNAEYAHDHEPGASERGYRHSLVWSYGVRDDTDIVVTLPYLRLRTDNDSQVTNARGLSDIGLDLKWRFYENGPLSMALKPGVTLPNGDETQGLGTGRHSYSAYLVTTLVSAPWQWHAHAGYIRNRNSLNEREDLRHVSVAAGRELGEHLRIVADIGTTTTTDKAAHRHPVFLIVGMIYAVSADFDLEIGYKKGLTDAETDRAWLAGVTLRF